MVYGVVYYGIMVVGMMVFSMMCVKLWVRYGMSWCMMVRHLVRCVVWYGMILWIVNSIIYIICHSETL